MKLATPIAPHTSIDRLDLKVVSKKRAQVLSIPTLRMSTQLANNIFALSPKVGREGWRKVGREEAGRESDYLKPRHGDTT